MAGQPSQFLDAYSGFHLSGTVIRVPPTLLNTSGKHPQHKPQRRMGTVQDKASSTKGRNLASPKPGLGREQ
jgi:hypothetical protein